MSTYCVEEEDYRDDFAATGLGDNVEEGGDEVLIAVEPAEEGRGDNVAIRVYRLDVVPVLYLRDRDLVFVGQGHLGNMMMLMLLLLMMTPDSDDIDTWQQ